MFFLRLGRENAVPVESCLHLALLNRGKKAIGLRFFTVDIHGVNMLLPNRMRTRRKIYTFVVWNKYVGSVQTGFYKRIIYFELIVSQLTRDEMLVHGYKVQAIFCSECSPCFL